MKKVARKLIFTQDVTKSPTFGFFSVSLCDFIGLKAENRCYLGSWSHSGPILVPFWLGMIRHLQQLFQSRSGCCSACIFPSKKTLSICCETLQTSLCYRAATYRDSSGSVSAPKHPNFIVWEGKWRQTVGNKVVKFVFCSPPLPSFTKLHFLSPPVQLGAVGGHSDRHKGELFLFSWGSDSHKPTPKNKTTTKKPREKENKQKPQDKLLRLNL